MSAPVKFDTIIADPDIDTRMRLKQACVSVHQFGKTYQLSTLREATARLSAGDRVDVCFISYRFDKSEYAAFIKEARQTKGGQDSAYILMLRSKDQDASVVATNVLAGFDGFLFEPYSVDQLVELTVIAARVRKERMVAREEAALTFLLNDIMNQVDQVAFLKASNFDLGTSFKKLKDLCAVLQTLEPDSMNIYSRLAIDLFEQAPLPKRIFQRKIYGGASSRIKKRQEKAILAQIESEADTVEKS